MRLKAVLFMSMVLTPAVCPAQQEGRLEGCVDPQIIATVLGELRPENSRPLSVEQFRAMWPTELATADVKSTDNSLFFRSDDRILSNRCQCCESFRFKARQEGWAGPLVMQGVTVNYSARRRGTLAETAQLFARAVGLGAADLKTVGAEELQNYQWEKFKGEERRLYVIELRFTREEGLWKMFFSTTFHVVEP
jgi:hypothetical protein